MKSPDKQTVMVTTALIGAHVSAEDDAAFSAGEVSVEDLGLWAASSVFEAFSEPSTANRTEAEASP